MAAIIAAHPSATLQRELNRQIKSTQSIHETNYTLIVSSVLVALSLTALLWLVVNVYASPHLSRPATHSLQRELVSPTADIAQNSVGPRFPALNMVR